MVVASLIHRSLNLPSLALPRYYTSLLQWGTAMGLSLQQAPHTPIPPALQTFRHAIGALGAVDFYSDGSFAIRNSTLLSQLMQSRLHLTREYLWRRGHWHLYQPPEFKTLNGIEAPHSTRSIH
jgi:hypothetical protein